MNIRTAKNVFLLLAAFSAITGCNSGSDPADGDNTGEVTSKRAGINEVLIHELADPDMLNPPNSTSANATYIQGNIFQTLLGTNPETYELYGLVAKSRPIITLIEEGEFADGMSLEYEIRPEATWDNGTTITANDYAFTIKAVLNPQTECEPLKPYYDFIGDIVIDAENPKKFVVYSSNTYMLAEEFSGYWVMPEYVYDPEQIMRKFSIRDLNSPDKRSALKGNSDIIKFAENFNHEKYQREKGFVVGSGAYEFSEWITGQKIILTRKKDWWGDQLKGTEGFDANPDKIIYEIINDWTTATTALKDEGIDLMRSVDPKKFVDLKDNAKVNQKFNFHTPTMFSYYYLGMNMRSDKLKDKKVRQALSHIVDKQKIIDVIMYGLAEPTISMVHPKKKHYNNSIQPYEYNLDKAKEMLKEAGWTDTDGDGILDKQIEGEKVDMKLEFKFNSGNDIRKTIGIMFKENARKVGIEVEIIAKEWTVFLEDVKSHKFEINCLAWVFGSGMSDPKQTWHTESAVINGSNSVGFGNEESDRLINELRFEPDEEKRAALYKEFQALVAEEAPYVFLFTPTERIAVHNRFEANAYSVRPGYNEGEFRLKETNLNTQQ